MHFLNFFSKKSQSFESWPFKAGRYFQEITKVMKLTQEWKDIENIGTTSKDLSNNYQCSSVSIASEIFIIFSFSDTNYKLKHVAVHRLFITTNGNKCKFPIDFIICALTDNNSTKFLIKPLLRSSTRHRWIIRRRHFAACNVFRQKNQFSLHNACNINEFKSFWCTANQNVALSKIFPANSL
jgi:hypothetical protein